LRLVAVQSRCLLPQDALQNSQNNQTELNIEAYSDKCPDTEVKQAPGNGAIQFFIEIFGQLPKAVVQCCRHVIPYHGPLVPLQPHSVDSCCCLVIKSSPGCILPNEEFATSYSYLGNCLIANVAAFE
jgi:hypothetical protein